MYFQRADNFYRYYHLKGDGGTKLGLKKFTQDSNSYKQGILTEEINSMIKTKMLVGDTVGAVKFMISSLD